MPESDPLVSVIIIFYDAERFLEEAIASVLNQSYDHWELLLIDDGSTDRSTEIAQRYAMHNSDQISYHCHAGHVNRGMSAARNLGLHHARGEYIAFLDSDDVWLPNKLDEQVAILEREPEAGMLYGRTVFWHSWDGDPNTRDFMTALPPVPLDTVIHPPKMLNNFLRDENIFPCMCSVIIRREVVDKVGAFEEEFRNANEDMVFHSKVFLHTPVYIASTCWDRYRQHPDSYWRKARQKGLFHGGNIPHPARERYLSWLEHYLDEENIDIPSVNRALRRAQWPYKHPKLYALYDNARRLMKAIYGRLRQNARRFAPPFVHRLYKKLRDRPSHRFQQSS